MRVPKGEKITLRINGELIILDIAKEFSLDQDVRPLPKSFAYLVSLKARLYRLLKEREREKDKYYYTQFLIIKDDDTLDYPKSNEWVKAEILEDEGYLDLLELYNQTEINYKIIVDLVKAFEIKVSMARAIMTMERNEKYLSS
jgi:hypothetical protein